MSPLFDASTPEETIAEWIGAGAPAEALLALLPEQHPLYAGRSTNETARIRGFILAAFEKKGLPQGALQYVLEELESGFNAYLVAAAARALRGAAADLRFAAYLRKAQRNIRYNDLPVTFDVYRPRWPVANPTSAMEEIQKTLAWLGAAGANESDCCTIAFPPDRARKAASLEIELEDQDGRALRFDEFFRGKLSVVAFFYTRCDNPEKCSLTIAQLARLQEAVESGPLNGQVRIAAITYDPLYDLAPRMKRFGDNRGVRFDDDVRFFRACDGFEELRARFDLGVNFIGSLVNRHRIELYVLDARGDIVATFSRMRWDVAAVIAELQSHLPGPRRRRQSLLSAIPPLFVALLPKCPLCLGAYLTAIGLGGMQAFLSARWTIPLLIALLLLNVWLVYRRSRQSHDIAALALALAGAAALLAGSVLWNVRPVAIAGAILFAVASLLSAKGTAGRRWLLPAFADRGLPEALP
jgi:protein SCO1/2